MTRNSWPDGRLLIVGLGNPGREYRNHRHNVGFLVVDRLAEQIGLTLRRVRAHSLIGEAAVEGRKIILAKPQTYMNLSGRAVQGLLHFHKLLPASLLVVCDDLDLPLGRIRLRPEGGSAGHRGLDSIIDSLGTSRFGRLRLGIGRPRGSREPSDYVLDNFSRTERDWVEEVTERASHCIRLAIRQGLEAAMTMFNAAPPEP
jgi:PTH1 family peptidyl-tRNA hydrolase